MADDVTEREELLNKYQNLDGFGKSITELASIIYEPVEKTRFFRCARQCAVKDTKGSSIVPTVWNALIEQLLEARLLIKKGDRLLCNPLIVEDLTSYAAELDGFEMTAITIRELFPLTRMGFHQSDNEVERCKREVRIGIYAHDFNHVNNTLKIGRRYYPEKIQGNNMYGLICNSPFRATWFKTLPLIMQLVALDEIVYSSIFSLNSLEKPLDVLREYKDNAADQFGRQFRDLLTTTLILRGEFDEASAISKEYPESSNVMARTAWCDFYRGNNDRAIEQYEEALISYRETNDNKNAYFGHISGLFFLLALLKTAELYNYSRLLEFIAYAEDTRNPFASSYRAVKSVIFALKNKYKGAKALLLAEESESYDSVQCLFSTLARFWIFPDEFKQQKDVLIESLELAKKSGFKLFELEFAALLEQLEFDNGEYKETKEKICSELDVESIVPIIEQKEHWERSTSAITFQSKVTDHVDNISINSRLIWLINFDKLEFTPKEQKISTAGSWTKGRTISFKKIKSLEVSSMTPQDTHIADAIEVYVDDDGTETFTFNEENALLAMAGHPLLFFAESPEVSVELTRKAPELHVRRDGESFEVGFDFDIDEPGMLLMRDTPTRYSIIDVDNEYRKIYDILGGSSITVTQDEKTDLLNKISEASDVMTVQSVVGLDSGDVAESEACTIVHLHLLPVASGFKLEMFIRPFKNEGPYFPPGSGRANLVVKLDDKLIQTTRDLDKELEAGDEVITSCPTLSINNDMSGEWVFDDPDMCLQLLLELEDISDEIVVEWPKGERFKLKKRVSSANLYLKVSSNQDWFSLDGELQIDENTVVSMQQLLDLTDNSKSNFIELGKGQFVALTDEFRKQLDDLNTYSTKTKDGIKLNPLAALAFKDISKDVAEFKVDQEWAQHIENIEQTLDSEPELPAGLNADLRDYQLEGFKWLDRLAEWGVGACLADDMGLGKTIQALAVTLKRSNIGPSLVLAPSSVCINWEIECLKFTPDLTPKIFGGKSRDKMLAELTKGDVLICSYGLLQQEAELLSEVRFSTIVLDEAQAIKNVATKRSQAAMVLNGDFRVITTGTPVQNHLGELWNLFNFINPGLLGSLGDFKKKFSRPIEKYQDSDARERLRKLITPFVLRRTKDQVLKELPDKTEITLPVQLSEEENAFYEALRRKAVSSLDTSEIPEGQKHIKILAEIMKLRRACCHPKLVHADSKIESSKLRVFGEVVDELLDNNHKALVFSQFVSHLTLLRESLDAKGISYQYLDGSTPVKERQVRIDAFQGGEGELFLISLKAGGFGLNLTEADYVIHMDPWWNPAVEDQATDRAHRIGQLKPVTIYRLVTAGTIEEKIVALHQGKRELADSLLDGTDVSGKVSTEELLQLIREN